MDNDSAIAELSRLLSSTTNPVVTELLQGCMHTLHAKAVVTQAPKSESEAKTKPVSTGSASLPETQQAPAVSSSTAAPTPLPSPLESKPLSASTEFTTLANFSWDQTEEMVKVYVPVEGVTKDMVTVDFTPTSFVLKVCGLEGKNYKCAVSPFTKPISVDASGFLVPKSHKRVVVKLQKASSSGYDERSWSNLTENTKIKPPASNPDDPSAGIMDLMKNMYEDGDDDMKRTIAKAWSESRDGKTPDMPKMPDMPSMPDISKDLPDMASMMKGL
eukprot:gene17354-20652_t